MMAAQQAQQAQTKATAPKKAAPQPTYAAGQQPQDMNQFMQMMVQMQ